jgi:hypothetical protein
MISADDSSLTKAPSDFACRANEYEVADWIENLQSSLLRLNVVPLFVFV